MSFFSSVAAMVVVMAASLQIASGFVVVARWSTDLHAIFVISDIRCNIMIDDE